MCYAYNNLYYFSVEKIIHKDVTVYHLIAYCAAYLADGISINGHCSTSESHRGIF